MTTLLSGFVKVRIDDNIYYIRKEEYIAIPFDNMSERETCSHRTHMLHSTFAVNVRTNAILKSCVKVDTLVDSLISFGLKGDK